MSRTAADPTLEAIEFLRAPGRVERVLANHHCRPDGRCSGCFMTRPVWPCLVATFALTARETRGAGR